MSAQPTTAGGALTIRGVGKSFGGTPVLAAIDLDVPAGQTTVLLGQSGSGKSTLLRIIAGLMRADDGEVQLDEMLLSDPTIRIAPEKRGIGMVFQALELWPHMTVAEHIAFGLPGRPRGRAALRNATVQALGTEVGLDASLLERRPDTLSGGERQRVAIARTIAADPSVILYDEPLASLDPERRGSLRALIRRLAAERRTTVVYVTHDANEALEMGDLIVVLEHGRVVEQGVGATLYAQPTTLAGARALGAVTVLPAIPGADGVETALGALDTHPSAESAAPTTEGDAPWCALLRPEQVGVTKQGGIPAQVLQCVVQAGGWRFVAEVGAVRVLGHASAPLAPGQQTQLVVHGKAQVIRATAAARTEVAV